MRIGQIYFVAAFCLAAGVMAADKRQDKPTAPDSKDKDYAAELPRIRPREPGEALKTFVTRPGFRIDLIASEPQVMSPVALDIDENGRIFVAEFPEYNAYANTKPHGRGRIVLLEDTQGTGRYDKRTVYADNIDRCVAVGCWDGGVYVGAPPDLLYLKDSKGDGKADIRRVVYTGFGTDHAGEGMINSFRWGLDNRYHISTNLDGGNVRPGNKPDAKPVSVRGHVFLLDPRDESFQLSGGGGQHGMSMDDWGRTFSCGNSDPYFLIMYDSRYLARNPYLPAPPAAVNIAPAGKYTKLHRISPVEPWRALRTRLRTKGIVPGSDEGGSPSGFFTGGTGVTVYRGDAFPSEYRGNLFVGDVANNVVHRARVQPNGVSSTALPAEKDAEFLASRDNWFRPVQFVNAPDGSLWVIDMYRELIEGAAFLPPVILKHMDVGSGVDRGRIYRIAPNGHKQAKLPQLGKLSTPELVALLEHPNGWHRDTASRLLYQRKDKSALEPLKKLAAAASPIGRAQALWALNGLDALTTKFVLPGLKDADANVRVQALRVAERIIYHETVQDQVTAMIDDNHLLVRYQTAFTLGRIEGQAHALATLARRDGADSWMRLAILCSSYRCAGELFGLLAADGNFRATPHGRTILGTLAAQIGAANKDHDVAAVLKPLAGLAETDKALARELVIQLVSKQPALAARFTGANSGQVRAILAGLLSDAKQTATDEKKAPAARVAAVRSLTLALFADVSPLLSELLASRQPPEVQTAAIETLARFNEPAVASSVLAAWKGFTPKVRATATESLFSRPTWINAFLDAVEKGAVARGDVDPARLDLLKSHRDPHVKARALKIFAGSGLARRADVVAAYAKALQLKGDAAKGRAVFKMHCATCHQLEGVGANVGADLKAIRDRGLEAVMLNILDPNREVKPQFLAYVAELKNGRALTGMITAETANNITIRRPDGVEEAVLRLQIEELRSTGLSYMPEGLEKQIDVPAMADLLAYLNSVK